jgi:uncharacterized protein YqgC (DUF456 family)
MGIFLTVIGLPGTVLIVMDVMAYALLTSFSQIGFKLILILVAMAVVAELVDFGLCMAITIRFGFSTGGMWAALIGSLAGAIILTPFFLGLGTLIGIFLGGSVAVFATEVLQRRKLKPAFRAGIGAMLGRTAGIAVKGLLSVVMAAITLFHIYS